MKKLLVYATKGGDTKVVSEYIASKLGFEIKEAKELNEEDLASAGAFIFAASTHGDGQIQAKFDDRLELLNKTDLDGKKVALVGVGNVERHGSDFCIGAWGAEGYKFQHSRAFVNGKFIGLTIDFKGDEHWQARADKWIAAVGGEF